MVAIIVPCTKQKVWDKSPNTGPVQARDAYLGPAFRTWRAYAEDSGSPWFILSTKYGLIEPDVSSSNYNVPIRRLRPIRLYGTAAGPDPGAKLDQCDRVRPRSGAPALIQR
jgi:hypothetical protein